MAGRAREEPEGRARVDVAEPPFAERADADEDDGESGHRREPGRDAGHDAAPEERPATGGDGDGRHASILRLLGLDNQLSPP